MTPSRPERPAKGSGRWGAFLAGAGLGLATVLADAAWRRWRARPPGPPKGSPADIGPRGWRAILRRTLSEFNEDRIPAVAAGSTFFALLALFPALGVFVSLYGLVGDLGGAAREIAEFQGVLPQGGVSVLGDQVARLAAASHASLGVAFFVSLLLSVWSANAGMKGLIAGLNVAYEAREKRNFFTLNLLSLAFTAGGIAFAMAAMAAIAAAPEVLAWLHLEALQSASLLRWPVMLVVTALVLSVLYRFAPCRHGARWRWITPGGALAAVIWMAMSVAFSFYVAHFGRYDRTYGSLGAIVGFMTWIWLSLTIVLAGAEFNSELESQAARPGRSA
jgi:membrane protein